MNNKETICEQVRKIVCCGDLIPNSYFEHLKQCEDCKKFWAQQNELQEVLSKTCVPGIQEGSIANLVMQQVAQENNVKTFEKPVTVRRFYWQRYIGTAAAAVVILVMAVGNRVWHNFDVDNQPIQDKQVNDIAQEQTSDMGAETKISVVDETENESVASTDESRNMMLLASPESVEIKNAPTAYEAYDLYDSSDDYAEQTLNAPVAQDMHSGGARGGGGTPEKELVGNVNSLFDMSWFDENATIAQNVSFANAVVLKNNANAVCIDENDNRLSQIEVKEFLSWIETLDSYEDYSVDSLIKYLQK